VSDSRVTLPVETFALLLRMQITRFNSESDDRLVDICASENPQCRLTREGGYVSLENLSSIFTPEADQSARHAASQTEPADSVPTATITTGKDLEDRAHTYQIPENELRKLFSILSPDANHRVEPAIPPSEPADSVPAAEIDSSQVLEDEAHGNEIVESELKKLLSIISPEANRRVEQGPPPAEPADSVPAPDAAAEQVQGDEIHTNGKFEDDEETPRSSKLKPVLGGIGVVAVALALVGYAIHASQQAQVEVPSSIATRGANSSPNPEVAGPGKPTAQDGQGSQAPLATQIKAPFGTWIDPATGLMWTLKDNRSDVNWEQAAEYCRDLRLAGHDDWRLPMVEELQGIYDAAVNVSGRCCGGTQVSMQVKGNLSLSGWQWSSAQRTPYGTPFSFYNGGRYTNLLSDSDGGRALCVRTLGQLLSRPTSGSEE